MKKTLFLLMFFLLLSVLCHADTTGSSEQLKEIRKRIEQTSGDLKEQQSAEKELLRDLSVVSTLIKKIDARVDSIKHEEKKIKKNISLAEKSLEKAKINMGSLSRKVNKRLVALYKEGEAGPLKLFFSSDSPMELVQQYQYLTKVLKYDRKLLNDFRVGIERQRKKQHQYELLKVEKARLLLSEQQNRNDAAEARTLYNQILKRVRKDKNQLEQELKSLEYKAQRLEKLLKKLGKQSKQQEVAKNERFIRLKGSLPWPIKGSVSVGFGTQHNAALGSVLESRGIEISYKTSQPVKAVAQGRIVFASWFKGYGNLIIIAHDSGYHTLYAQVDSLNQEIGDIVNQGDIVANVGSIKDSGLYFEIRHNGSAVDPLVWLKAN